MVFVDLGAFRPLTWPGGSATNVRKRVWDTVGVSRGGGIADEGDSSEQELRFEEAFSTNDGDRVVRGRDSGLESSSPANAWNLSQEGGE